MAENYIVTLRFTGQGQTAEQPCSFVCPWLRATNRES
jgi:hypothetical protein